MNNNKKPVNYYDRIADALEIISGDDSHINDEYKNMDYYDRIADALENIAENGSEIVGGANKLDINYETNVLSLKKDNTIIEDSNITLPAYGINFDSTTGGLTLTKNGTAISGQTVTIPNYGSPVGVTSSSDMTDHDTIYLYEGATSGSYTNGHFYYWDGTAWADGGEYAAATVQTDKTLLVEDRAADAKATGEAVDELKTQINNISEISKMGNLVNEENLLNISGAIYENGYYKFDTRNAHNAYFNTSFPHEPFKANTVYTLSAIFKQDGEDATKRGLFVIFRYTDGSTQSELKTPWKIDADTLYYLTSNPGKTIEGIYFSYGQIANCYMKNFMVVEGDTVPSEYIPYEIESAVDVVARAESANIKNVMPSLEVERVYNISRSNGVKAISHRGWHEAPENTIVAYKESRNHGFVYVEADVRFTSDGVAVLLHEASINSTARNNDGTALSSTINIADITYAQALQYDFGIYKNVKYAGTKIPTLKEFLTFCKKVGLKPYLELKVTPVENVYNVVKECSFVKECTFIGPLSYISAIKAIDGSARLGFLTSNDTQEYVDAACALKTGSNDVFMNNSLYNNALIEKCIVAGLNLEVWTINDENTILSLDPYISGVTSDNKNASIILYDDAMN